MKINPSRSNTTACGRGKAITPIMATRPIFDEGWRLSPDERNDRCDAAGPAATGNSSAHEAGACCDSVSGAGPWPNGRKGSSLGTGRRRTRSASDQKWSRAATTLRPASAPGASSTRSISYSCVAQREVASAVGPRKSTHSSSASPCIRSSNSVRSSWPGFSRAQCSSYPTLGEKYVPLACQPYSNAIGRPSCSSTGTLK